MRKELKLSPLTRYDYSPDLSLRIRPSDGHYMAEIRGLNEYFDEFKIPLSVGGLGALNGHLVGTIQELAEETEDVNLSARTAREHSRKLAAAGALAFHEVFANRLKETRDLFLRLSSRGGASFQVISEQFAIPWELLYFGRSPSSPLFEHFLGAWEVSRTAHFGPRPSSCICSPTPVVGLVADRKLDWVVGAEIPLFDGFAKKRYIALKRLPELDADPKRRPDELRVLKAFLSERSLNVAHFACHANYDSTNPYNSRLLPPNEFSFSCADMVSMQLFMAGHPFVFLNACESGNLDPEVALYLSRQFLLHGARAVIGTQCEIPDKLASMFAMRFYAPFLIGESVGASLRVARTALASGSNNLLGFAYGLFGPPNIRLEVMKDDLSKENGGEGTKERSDDSNRHNWREHSR